MSDLIISRTPVTLADEPATWLVGSDVEAMGLERCGCGAESGLLTRVVTYHGPVIQVTFLHNHARCVMAFDRTTFRPIGYEEYCALFPAQTTDEAGF